MQRTSQTSTPAGIEGIVIPPAVFADRLAFIEAVKSGVSGEVTRCLTNWNRDLGDPRNLAGGLGGYA